MMRAIDAAADTARAARYATCYAPLLRDAAIAAC